MEGLPLEMDYLTEELIRKAEVELGETPERRKAALAEMRAYVKEDTKLYCSIDDYYLLEFLRPKKFNVKKAMNLLQNYYQIKKSCKDVFGKREFDCLGKVCRDKFISAMPYRDEDGCILLLIQPGNWNYREMPFIDAIHGAICIIIGLIDLHPPTQVCGIKIIIDVKDMTIKHILHMPPRILHVIARALSVCAPARMRAFHVVNESVIIKYAWSIMKLVLSEKLKKRVYFHSTNLEALTNKINPALIPEDIGGTLKYDNSSWIKFVESQGHKYDELTGYGYKPKK